MAFFGEGLLGEGAAATGVGEASGSFGATGVGGAVFSGEGDFGADGRRRGGSGSRSGFAASLSVSRACSCERLWFGVSVAGAAGVGRAAGVVCGPAGVFCGPAGVGLGGVCGFFGFGEAAVGFLGEVSLCFSATGAALGEASGFGKKLGLFGCRGAAAASGFGGASAFSGDGRVGAGAFAFF